MQKPQQQKQLQQQPHHLLPKLSFPPPTQPDHHLSPVSPWPRPGRRPPLIGQLHLLPLYLQHQHHHLHAKPSPPPSPCKADHHPLSWPEPRPPRHSSAVVGRRPQPPDFLLHFLSFPPPSDHNSHHHLFFSTDNRRPPPPTPPHVGPQLPHVATPRIVVHPRAPPCTRCRQQQCNSTAAVRGRARVQAPPPAPPPSWLAEKTPMPGAPYAAFPWRPTSSGMRRRGDFCVLNEIPSTRASFELRIGAPSQQLRVRFYGDPTVGSAISSLHRNLVSRGQLRQLVSPPPQLCLACY
ncbi:proline-rich receptor-like protein kinase PERK12 [Iris pallida]|uniref:Proline-rich receptor-like protein kinase PERK12 n=1 Tax=Iris pallida TaxID=29817 RepID=A0AAX6FRT8_IRIPA|nr:proline-rich receptor-like protein kinase PERK12 [Iris pallida]